MKYCSIPEGLADQLASLRTEFLTPNALKQFDEVEKKEFQEDNGHGYDLLILGFDFDNLSRPSIKMTPINEDTYQVSFAENKTLKIKVVKQGKEYRIDSISKGEE